MILHPIALAQLTDRVRPSAQARVLDKLGIPYRTRPDKSLVVLVADVEQKPAKLKPTVRLKCEPAKPIAA